MSLKEKFQQIKAAIAQAINFADPAEVLQKAEHEFMEASAEAYHALEDRVVELETQLKSLIDPTAKAEEPPASDPRLKRETRCRRLLVESLRMLLPVSMRMPLVTRETATALSNLRRMAAPLRRVRMQSRRPRRPQRALRRLPWS